MESIKLRWLYGTSSFVSIGMLIIMILTAVSFASGVISSIIKNVLLMLVIFGIFASLEIVKWRKLPNLASAKWASWLIILGSAISIFVAVTGIDFIGGGNMIIDIGGLSSLVLPTLLAFIVALILNIYSLFKSE